MPPSWPPKTGSFRVRSDRLDLKTLRVIAFVQDDASKEREILQAVQVEIVN